VTTALDRNDCTKTVQCAQATRSTRYLILLWSFSTRFSTELLKTFTHDSYLYGFFICNWLGDCIVGRFYFSLTTAGHETFERQILLEASASRLSYAASA
jgi:hypothetical protein